MSLQGCIKSLPCRSIPFVGNWASRLTPVQGSNTGLKMRNNKCECLTHPCNGIRSYSRASYLNRLMMVTVGAVGCHLDIWQHL